MTILILFMAELCSITCGLGRKSISNSKTLTTHQNIVCYKLTSNNIYHPRSMTSILHSMHWPTLETRRTVNRLIVFHKIIYHQVATEIPQHYLVNNRKTRHSHSVNIMQPQCNTKAYEFSFYPRTIRDWNKLPGDTLQTQTRAPSREISGHTFTPRPEIRRCCRWASLFLSCTNHILICT